MNKLAVKSKNLILKITSLEKKRKIIANASLLLLTVSTYFLRSENQEVKIKHATLQEKSAHIKQNMIIFNSNYEDFPLPVWQKVKRGGEFVIQYINPVYVDKFGHIFNNDRYSLIGKNNFEIFPKKIAQRYYENDVAVAITGNKIENIEESISKDGRMIKLKVMKWRDIKDEKDTLIYGMVKEILD